MNDCLSHLSRLSAGGSAVGRIAFDVQKAGLSDAVLFLTIIDSETFDEAAGFFAVT